MRIEDQERFDDYGFKVHLLSLPFCTFHLPPLLVVNYHAIPGFKDKSKLKKRGTERVGDGALHGKPASSRVKLSKPHPDSQLLLIGLLGAIREPMPNITSQIRPFVSHIHLSTPRNCEIHCSVVPTREYREQGIA